MTIKRLRYHPWLVISLLMPFYIFGQQHQDRLQKIDVQHYDFSISLSDTSDMIFSKAIITILFNKPVRVFTLNLADQDENGKGMVVKNVKVNGIDTDFRHHDDSLYIYYNVGKPNTTAMVNVEYSGIPDDGLIISKNKFGDRTFFADSWPDHAHYWFPCIDHPSDKATVEFKVSAPENYEVIANGDMIKETITDHNYKITDWQSDEPLPTKVMVIGVADFAIDNVENNLDIPVSTWVYPMDAEKGFADYLITTEPLSFYITNVAPYPFSKLANVQSTTIFGGMENAGNIFYAENLVTGNQRQEEIIAHEIAHQWFGNSVTEGNWHHVWLSEGFATYLTHLYYENKYGRDVFKSRMESDRKVVIRYASRNFAPVIDTTITDYLDLLNPNSYEKGAWFLHMLRKELGDDLFWNCIRAFYEKFKYSNALTGDLKIIAESASGKDMDTFFEQWLYKAGHPVINISWYQKKKNILVQIEQLQKGTVFDFPLELGFVRKDGSIKTGSVHMKKVLETFSFPVETTIKDLVVDPDVWLLYDGKVTKGKF